MKTSIAATLVALTLAGCSSSVLQPKDDPIITELQGKSADFVESKLGLPNRRSETRSGAQIWTYLDKQKGMAAKQCEVTLSIRDAKVESVVISTDNQSLLSSMVSGCNDIRKTLTGHS
ncbi:MAG: hypothetical protein R3F47_17300 [Gammaproteobacteria bacterium]|jgi:hypothetical protein